jgi:uncharacterized protein YndB with AHSA1/START domain
MAVKEQSLKIDVTQEIVAPVEVVFAAFFESAALGAWHRTSRSIAVPRLLGPYVLEWPPSDDSDDILGRLGGIFRATVMQIEANDHVFLADAFWLPPDGGPLGPFAMQITFTQAAAQEGARSTVVRVVMTGFDDGPRWQRYLEHATVHWQMALSTLKSLLGR